FQIDFLLELSRQSHPSLLPHNRHYWSVIALSVVQTVHEVDRPGPRCGNTHSNIAGEVRVSGCHESRFFFVCGADVGKILARFLGAPHCAIESADAVTWIAIPVVQAPFD